MVGPRADLWVLQKSWRKPATRWVLALLPLQSWPPHNNATELECTKLQEQKTVVNKHHLHWWKQTRKSPLVDLAIKMKHEGEERNACLAFTTAVRTQYISQRHYTRSALFHYKEQSQGNIHLRRRKETALTSWIKPLAQRLIKAWITQKKSHTKQSFILL